MATLLALSAAASAALPASQEISTATTHARMAGDAGDLTTAVMHFHHVINCLVGPKSKLLDADVGNPCKDMGNGALNDVDSGSAQHAVLSRALLLAEQALHAKDLAASQKFVARIATVLKSVSPTQ
ncbi:MAG: hypothetical protein ACRETQ_09120 [Gammaproteobacteria bacterium]